ncbi:hypothetical protein [uncultured Limosilactobacillus sp.]|uniref:hypothetical protein n=1 Tax=uncultured Limosilactobacillus sp. TaxID=2837629 RepID=UPI0025FCC42E|nr:hypothetical protein [uncultured Limosilactobacillus sp.]
MSKHKFSLPASTQWILLIGMGALVATILNTDNPIMRYYNVPRDLFLSEGTTGDYLYIIGLALCLLLAAVGFHWVLAGSDRPQRRAFKWWQYGLALIVTIMITIGLQGWMALYPDPTLLLVPDTTNDLQYLNVYYWALIAVVNLAFFTWAWLLAVSASHLLARQHFPLIIQLIVALVIFASARLMNMDGSYGYQLVVNLLMVLPMLLWTIYTRRIWIGLISLWVVYEAVIYLLFITR